MFRKAEKNAVEIQKSVLDTIVSEILAWMDGSDMGGSSSSRGVLKTDG